MPKLTKHERYNIFIEEFNKRVDKVLDIYDEQLAERLQGKSPKTIQRYFEEFMSEHNSIVEVEGRKRKTYKLINPIDLFIETFEHFEDLGWLFSMAQDADPGIFKELEEYTKDSKHIYQFKNTPFEDTKTLEEKETFKRLKDAVKNREYRKITFKGSVEDNLKCLKMIYMENNWYIAYVNSKDKLLFGRVSFIERVDYASNVGKFQPSTVSKQLEFIKNIQNSMTLYGKEKKIAKIKALPYIAKYFEKGMKLRLSSQKVIDEFEEDGSVIFTLEYTQPMEILPLIQSWMPNLIILEPAELKEEYIKKLQRTIQNMQ